MIDVEVAEEKEREAEDNILKQCCEMERDRQRERYRWWVGGGDDRENITWTETLLGDRRNIC